MLSEKEILNLPSNKSRRYTKDLPVSDILALLMVRESKDDVAAVFIQVKEFVSYKIWMTKDRIMPADKLHANKILGLFLET